MRPSERFGEGAWQVPRRLDPLSTLMWRCERDPLLRSGLVLLVLLDRPPDRERFIAGHEWATRMIPRLRERPVAPLLTPTMPVWVPDPQFDVARHVRRAGLAPPAGRRELLDLAEQLAATPFDVSRPPWESVLVEELNWEPGRHRAAWLVKFHHSLADGHLVASWLAALLSHGREPRKAKPRPPVPPQWLDSIPDRLLGPPVGGGPAVRRVGLAARSALAAARAPLGTAAEIGAMARTLAEVTTRSVGKPSPLLRSRGTTRRFEFATIDLDRLRSSARTAEVSVNAAYCAALLAGLRRYHRAHGVAAATVPAAMTMPIRRGGPWTGNRFNGVKFAGPLDEDDPRALCRAVDRRLAAAAPPFPPPVLDAVLTCVNQLPTAALTRLAQSLGRSYDLQLSHVVAPGRDAYVSGARVEQVCCFGPTPGCAVMALLVSRHPLGTLALTVDTAAVPDLPALLQCIEAGFADIIEGCAGGRVAAPGVIP